jgi:1,4-alpha-glucan branching enzyme
MDASGGWRSMADRKKKKPVESAKPALEESPPLSTSGADRELVDGVHRADLQRLLWGRHHSPHSVLGAHPARRDGMDGVVIRVLQPEAETCTAVLADGRAVEMPRVTDALFSVFLPSATLPLQYRLRFTFAGGATWEREDAYRFLPTLGEVDLHLFNEGTHRRLWDKLGAHITTMDGVSGVAFAVWAPTAQRVSVVGDFARWV